MLVYMLYGGVRSGLSAGGVELGEILFCWYIHILHLEVSLSVWCGGVRE